MCGICGKVARSSQLQDDDVGIVGAMIESLQHRGPDGNGQKFFPCAGLGHVRLSIIDIATGGQPMSNEAATVCVVFNGEIYNFQEIRTRLENLGHRFATRSDTEVIIHAYEQFGEDCVKQFRGMFAFALWDEEHRKLILARDRLGKKPLYYAETTEGLVFASELRPVFCDPAVPSDLDHSGLLQYLHCGFIAAPLSIYEGVRKLPPAHYAVYQNGQLRIENYWSLDFTQTGPRELPEATEALEEILTEAVRLRMIADVPLGAFLSGGVDSTLVVALMAQLASQPVRTYSIGFPDTALDETAYATEAANVLGTEHTAFEMGEISPEFVERIAWHFSEPHSDPAALPTFVLSELARKHVTVAVNGDGGDEAFGGYGRYYHILGMPVGWEDSGDAWRAWASRLPEATRSAILRTIAAPLCAVGVVSPLVARRGRVLQELAAPFADRYWAKFDVLGRGHLSAIMERNPTDSLGDAWVPDAARRCLEKPVAEQLSAIQHADLMGFLPDLLLAKVDITSMANGLECRSPLLDHLVVEFAASLPAHLKTNPRHSKYVLKEFACGLVPRGIIYRPKQGFATPIARWLSTSLRPLLEEHLLRSPTSASGVLRTDGVTRLMRHAGQDWRAAQGLWRLLMFELWYRHRPSLRVG